MPTILFDRNTVIADTPLPAGKTGEFYWDTIVKKLGVRVRLLKSGTIQRSFVVQIRVGGSTKQRRRTLKGVKLPDVDKARAKALAVVAKADDDIDPFAEKDGGASALKFSAAVEQYLKLKKLKVRHSSLRLSTLYLTHPRYFGPLHKMPLAKITQSAVSARLDAIYVESGASTAGQARKHLSAFFVWCMKRGHCAVNPVINTEAAKSGPGRDRVLSSDELRAVWSACKDDDLGRIVKLLVLTGCRASEIGVHR